MPSIGDMQYGFDSTGVDQYLNDIKAIVLTNAAGLIKDTSAIKTTCDNEWEGKAKEAFEANLDKTANHVADQFTSLYNVLNSEVDQVHAAMANKDESMIAKQ